MNKNFFKSIAYYTVALLLFTSFTACKKDGSSNTNGSIEYTIDGKTYTQTDNISAAFISGKFQGLSDDNLDAKVGDSQDIAIAIGTTYSGIRLYFIADGTMYASGASSKNKVTFTKNEANLLEGTFEGQVKKDGDIANPAKTITGKFTVKSFTRI